VTGVSAVTTRQSVARILCDGLLLGVLGAVMLGQQRVDIGTIVRGPLAFWDGLNKPVDS